MSAGRVRKELRKLRDYPDGILKVAFTIASFEFLMRGAFYNENGNIVAFRASTWGFGLLMTAIMIPWVDLDKLSDRRREGQDLEIGMGQPECQCSRN